MIVEICTISIKEIKVERTRKKDLKERKEKLSESLKKDHELFLQNCSGLLLIRI